LPPIGAKPQRGLVVADDGFGWPVSGGAILSHFDDPRRHHRHRGLDIRGVSGQEIVASRAGRVVYSGNTLKGYGNMIILDHGDGIQTLYAHGEALLVEVGEQVEKGQPIARIGRTGNATTEHCHFEIRKDKLPVDPLPFLTTVAQALP
jgi:murein DD-endopeptidase MepM/ murein hydrolase activator NlpD